MLALKEEIEAIKMEKEDAYNKIAILEKELMCTKICDDSNTTQAMRNEMDDRNNLNELKHLEINDSFDIALTDNSLPKEKLQDAKIYQRYREFQQKFDKQKTQEFSRFHKRTNSGVSAEDKR